MATLNPRDVVIVDGVRSAMGKTKNGMFRNVRADSLSAELVRALLLVTSLIPMKLKTSFGVV